MTDGLLHPRRKDDIQRVNNELVDIACLQDKVILKEHLRGLVNQHHQHTGSEYAQDILSNFDQYITKFKLVKPKTSDVKLLGHISRSSSELRIQAQ